MRLSYNDYKYNERNTGGRNALDDYLHDREYWITQGGHQQPIRHKRGIGTQLLRRTGQDSRE